MARLHLEQGDFPWVEGPWEMLASADSDVVDAFRRIDGAHQGRDLARWRELHAHVDSLGLRVVLPDGSVLPDWSLNIDGPRMALRVMAAHHG